MKQHPVILVVDESEVFELMKPVLLREFYEPRLIHYADKKQAMDYILSDKRADLIFVDWDMVEEDFFNLVRTDLENHNTPVIIMTECVNDTVISSALKYGITQHLAKPFLDKALIQSINQIMSFQEGRRKRRLHPDHSESIRVTFESLDSELLNIIDISCDGCLVRVSNDIARHAFIYHIAQIDFKLYQFDFQLKAQVWRIGHDYPLTEEQDHVLVMLKFIETDDSDIDQLNLLLDELQSQWHY